MNSRVDFTARWLHIFCMVSHCSFSELWNDSTNLMPFSLFWFTTIRVWKVSQETIQIFTVYIQVFHRRADSCGFPALQQYWCCFNALLEGSLSVMVDTTMTDAYQAGLHFPQAPGTEPAMCLFLVILCPCWLIRPQQSPIYPTFPIPASSFCFPARRGSCFSSLESFLYYSVFIKTRHL